METDVSDFFSFPGVSSDKREGEIRQVAAGMDFSLSLSCTATCMRWHDVTDALRAI